MALNVVWLGFFLVSFVAACIQLASGNLTVFPAMLASLFDSARTAFEIALGLAGVMSLWLGLMKVGETAGVIQLFARAMGPFFARIFPEVPRGHPAGGSSSPGWS